MIRPITRDTLLLSRPCADAVPSDLPVADDLLDTLRAHAAECVGLAANMIGVSRRIIAVNTGFLFLVMFNPEMTKGEGAYEAEEGCLSLPGVRKTRRYQTITVRYTGRHVHLAHPDLHRICRPGSSARNRPLQRHFSLKIQKTCLISAAALTCPPILPYN